MKGAVNTLIKLTWLFNYLKLRLKLWRKFPSCSEKENNFFWRIDHCLFVENFSWLLRSPQESRLPSSKSINLISSLVSETDQHWGQSLRPEIKTEKTMLNEKLIGQNYFSARSWWATASRNQYPRSGQKTALIHLTGGIQCILMKSLQVPPLVWFYILLKMNSNSEKLLELDMIGWNL